MLEYNLIQKHRPRFNIRYRDDKSYPYLALTVGETWPRAQVLRGAKRKNVRYFGPYGHAWAIRETLDALTRVFPVRTCSNAFFDQRARARRPCLYYDIGRCSGPCVPTGDRASPRSRTAPTSTRWPISWPATTKPVLASLEREMARGIGAPGVRAGRASSATSCRRPAGARDPGDGAAQPEDLDVVGLAEDDLEAAFQVFFVRGGRVLGRRGWVVDRVEDLDRDELVASFVRQLYMERERDPAARAGAGAARRSRGARGVAHAAPRTPRSRSRSRSAVRSASCCEVVDRNAAEAFQRHKLRRASDFGARSRALARAGRATRNCRRRRLRIECYDISNLGPTDTVGSMVVFEDGLPKRRTTGASRSRACAGQDDFASMEEMLRRRFERLRKERDEPPREETVAPFAYPPSLVVVDGGRGQLGVGTKVLADLGLDDPAHRSGQTTGGGLLPRSTRAADDPARRPRRCSSCSTCATRRTGSPSPITARSGRSARWRRRSTRSPASVPRGRRRC